MSYIIFLVMSGSGVLLQHCCNAMRTCSKHVLQRNTESTITFAANSISLQNHRQVDHLSSSHRICSVCQWVRGSYPTKIHIHEVLTTPTASFHSSSRLSAKDYYKSLGVSKNSSQKD